LYLSNFEFTYDFFVSSGLRTQLRSQAGELLPHQDLVLQYPKLYIETWKLVDQDMHLIIVNTKLVIFLHMRSKSCILKFDYHSLYA
jgi:hypothetical protein